MFTSLIQLEQKRKTSILSGKYGALVDCIKLIFTQSLKGRPGSEHGKCPDSIQDTHKALQLPPPVNSVCGKQVKLGSVPPTGMSLSLPDSQPLTPNQAPKHLGVLARHLSWGKAVSHFNPQ
jgi:hypothetical protein